MGKTYKKVNDWGKAPKKKKAQGVVRPQQLEDKAKEVQPATADWWEDYYPDEDEDFEKFNRRK